MRNFKALLGACFLVSLSSAAGAQSLTPAGSLPPGAGVKEWIQAPSGANLATALTTPLPLSKGGTGQAAAGGAMIDALSAWGFTGLIKRNGANSYSAAIAGTDYAPPTSGTSILAGNGSGGFSNVTLGSGLSYSGGTLSASGGGGGGTPGGTEGAIQYNSSGSFGGAVVTGLVKGNGTSAPTAAVAGTDYLTPSGSAASLTGLPIVGGTTGTLSIARGGTGQTAAGGAMIDALSGWSSTGFLRRTGSGTYAFLETSGMLDLLGSTRGSILYRGAAGWVALTPGTNGQVLKTGGAGADPSWQNETSGGSPAGSVGNIQVHGAGGVFAGRGLGTGLVDTGTAIALTGVTQNQASANYTVVAADAAKTIRVGAFTYTLPQAGSTGFGNGWGACFVNTAAGNATINSTSTFLGAGGGTSLTVAPGTWACPTSDGTNYVTVRSQLPGSTHTVAPIGWVAATNPNSAVVLTADVPMTVTGIRGRVAAAVGATATITLRKAASGTACGSGTAIHSGTFNANGTANANQTLTVTTAGSANVLAAGDSICVDTANGAAFTAGTGNGGITVTLTVP